MKATEQTKETFSALMDRIKSAGYDRNKLDKCDAQITKHYNNCTITAKQYERLDIAIFDRYVVGSGVGIQ